MAWALRGVATATDTAGTSATCTHGITISDGDLVIVTAVEDVGDADLAIDDSGWTAIGPTTGNGCGQSGWCKLASTEPVSYTVSNKQAGNEMQVRVAVFYDAAGGTLTIDDSDASSSAGDVTDFTSAAVDAQNNGLVYASFGCDTGTRVIDVNPSGTEVGAKAGTAIFISTWYETVSAGSETNAISIDTADGLNAVVVAAHFTPGGGGTPGFGWYNYRMNQ